MNGFIAKKGREVGIPAPTHEMIMALVQRVESGASDPKPENLRELLQAA